MTATTRTRTGTATETATAATDSGERQEKSSNEIRKNSIPYGPPPGIKFFKTYLFALILMAIGYQYLLTFLFKVYSLRFVIYRL